MVFTFRMIDLNTVVNHPCLVKTTEFIPDNIFSHKCNTYGFRPKIFLHDVYWPQPAMLTFDRFIKFPSLRPRQLIGSFWKSIAYFMTIFIKASRFDFKVFITDTCRYTFPSSNQLLQAVRQKFVIRVKARIYPPLAFFMPAFLAE